MGIKLEKILELSQEAAVYVEDGRVSFANHVAEELFGHKLEKHLAAEFMPEYIASAQEDFTAAATIADKPCRVSGLRQGASLVLLFSPERESATDKELVSDPFVNAMLTSVLNIGLSMDLIARHSPAAEETDPKLAQHVSILYHNYYTVRRLVGNLSTAHSLRNGNFHLFRKHIDLIELCSNLVATASVMLSDKANLSFTTDCSVLVLDADPSAIERLLLNLIANSCEALGEDGGSITLKLERRDRRAIISVNDNGKGIPPEVLSNVFTRYETAFGNDLSNIGGAGLGLGISRGIAEAHGGSLLIESREGVGTSVRVMLPLGDPSIGTFASPSADRYSSGMDVVLTELSGLLDSSCYAARFRE